MSEPSVPLTGDPHIDAYLKFRKAVLDGASWPDLVAYAEELKAELPTLTPSPPAAMFIHTDIIITCGHHTLSPAAVTALWVPNSISAKVFS